MLQRNTRDFRSLDTSTQAELRRQALRDVDAGRSRQSVATTVEVHVKTVGIWIRTRKELEKRMYHGAKRGRTPHTQKFLSARQEASVKKIIETQTPEEAGIPFALWNRKAIRMLVKKKTKKTIALQTVSAYTKRWGLTPQRPAKYAVEQDAAAIHVWREKTYPAIVEKARKEGVEIHWEDETGIALSTFYARSYAPKGKTPVIRLPGKRTALSMISSITNRGDLRFMLYRGALTTDRFLLFLTRLTRDADRKVFLIADNLSVHKAKRVQRWVTAHLERIEIFFPTPVRAAAQPR